MENESIKWPVSIMERTKYVGGLHNILHKLKYHLM